MGPGVLARWCISMLSRYQASEAAHRYEGRCRFDPSCSRFAEEAFSEVSFPLAFARVTWRFARCNPFLTRRSKDPVRRGRARRVRPNAIRTLSAAALLAGLVLVVLSSVAAAQSISGGCTGTVNGRSPASMTKSDPLVVEKGDSVQAQGTAPGGAKGQNVTVVSFYVIEPWGKVSSEQHEGDGASWGGSASVDERLPGVGLYKGFAEASGQGWSCEASGYIRVDGNPLSEPMGQAGAGAAVLGAAGVALAAREKKVTADTVKKDFADDAEWLIDPEGSRKRMMNIGCGLIAIVYIFMYFLMGGFLFAAVPTGSGKSAGQRRRASGHPVLGFVSGLIFGLGAALLGQQYGKWTLNAETTVVMPVVFAILAAIRGWYGTPYKVTRRAAS